MNETNEWLVGFNNETPAFIPVISEREPKGQNIPQLDVVLILVFKGKSGLCLQPAD